MKNPVIGARNVGSTLGKLWAERGHEGSFGLRDASSEKAQTLRSSWNDVTITNVVKAVEAAEVVVIAVPGAVIADVAMNGGDWSGKIIIDTRIASAPATSFSLRRSRSRGRRPDRG